MWKHSIYFTWFYCSVKDSYTLLFTCLFLCVGGEGGNWKLQWIKARRVSWVRVWYGDAPKLHTDYSSSVTWKKTTRKTYLISFLTPFRSDILRIQVLKRSWATPESEVLSSSWICSEPSRVCGIMLQLYRISYMQHYHQLNLSVCLSVSFQLKKTWLRMRDSDPVT